MEIYVIFAALFAIASGLLTAFHVYFMKGKSRSVEAKSILLLLSVWVLLVGLYGYPGISISVFLLFALLISEILVYYYLRSAGKFGLILAFLLAYGALEATTIHGFQHYIVLPFAIGTLVGFFPEYLKRSTTRARNNKKVEVKRDYVQIAFGIIIIAAFGLGGALGFPAAFALILLGYSVNAFALGRPKSAVTGFLGSFERDADFYGSGAMFLAIGTMLVIGIVTDLRFVEFAMVVLFFSDSAATIFGIKFGGAKLYYNKGKTVAGTLAFVLVSCIFGYGLLGYVGIALGIALGIAESLKLRHVDDNILLSVLLGAFYLVGL